MQIQLRIGFKPYFTITTLTAIELQAFRVHVKSSLEDYYKPDLQIYAEMYKTNKIFLTVNYVHQEEGMWLVEFNEQNEINKRAMVHPETPQVIELFAYEEETSSLNLQ